MLKKICLLIPFLLAFAFVSSAEGRYPHRDFDWEGDDKEEDLPGPTVESCFACHYGGMFPVAGFPRKKCEACHVINASLNSPSGPYKYYALEAVGEEAFVLRSDYRDPTLVNSHLSVRTPKSTDYSTCLSIDNTSGSCHGVSYSRREKAGGFYAFNDSVTRFPLDEPYVFSLPANNFPDTKDCLFCHVQSGEDIKKSWGDPTQLGLRHVLASGLWRRVGEEITSVDCQACHFKGVELKNFHSQGIFVERKKLPMIPVIIIATLILAISFVVWKKLRGGASKKDRDEQIIEP